MRGQGLQPTLCHRNTHLRRMNGSSLPWAAKKLENIPINVIHRTQHLPAHCIIQTHQCEGDAANYFGMWGLISPPTTIVPYFPTGISQRGAFFPLPTLFQNSSCCYWVEEAQLLEKLQLDVARINKCDKFNRVGQVFELLIVKYLSCKSPSISVCEKARGRFMMLEFSWLAGTWHFY